MSARIPSPRLGQSALSTFRPQSIRWFSATQQRDLRAKTRRKQTDRQEHNVKIPDKLRNPILDEYLAKQEKESVPQRKSGKPARPKIREGDLGESLFSRVSDRAKEIPGWRDDLSPEEKRRLRTDFDRRKKEAEAQQDMDLLSMNLDPNPAARKKVERKLVIAGVKRHGRMTKAQKLLRTERQSLYKSHNLPTSTKKLQKVINQIAGKTVSEALLQLRFSKKRVARDVIKGLEIAHNEAITTRGMGLAGKNEAAIQRWNDQRSATDVGKARDTWDYKTSNQDALAAKAKAPRFKTTTIELKDGTNKIIKNPSEIYIDQAWVGPGEGWKGYEFRARGAINLLRHRTTSFSVLLKEEKTRIRLSDEIKKKRDNRKLWVALPDRPVTSQRQYCLW